MSRVVSPDTIPFPGKYRIVAATPASVYPLTIFAVIVVTIAPVKKGEVFTKENIWVKRPGTGEIPAREYENVLGKKAAEDIAVDTQITRNMVE